MKTTKVILSLTIALFLMTAPFILANNDPNKNNNKEATTEVTEDKATIVGVAASNADFSTLVAAVKAAGLVETLNSEGPFTVFAPTNDAFAKLPEGTVDSLLKEENKGTLTSILTYHVVAGKFAASDVLKAIKDNGGKFIITTVNGEKLKAYTKDGKVMLKDAKGNTATIILTDVEASNGVIHAIDSVVMP
ncbi:fasciclin domain-containing protein [Lutimonas halocynthiae]|uniref:fasciclin domain-containing protein n=1 Tax=Lutimonas halocynthiae TaxID=1446477 RepID=UPI0025B319E2|nr:fasciclin domain-containing protein [Lutimonas halocynthiae]MDN3642819.1 fasciclin domain-containing protein [Lutimonas halocynthiae]